MNRTQSKQIIKSVEILYKDVMGLYWAYLNFLENLAQKIPDEKIDTLEEIYVHIKEIHESMEYDMGVFENAVDSDLEDASKVQEQLKIKDIYKKLKK